MPIGEAVDKGIVANQTLGYFIARISLFLLKIGINPDRLRCVAARVHRCSAHSARRAGSASIWVTRWRTTRPTAGMPRSRTAPAGRSASGARTVQRTTSGTPSSAHPGPPADARSVHAKKTGANLSATEQLKEPVFTDEWVAELNKKTFGKHFGRDTGAVQQALLDLSQPELIAAQTGLEHG